MFNIRFSPSSLPNFTKLYVSFLYYYYFSTLSPGMQGIFPFLRPGDKNRGLPQGPRPFQPDFQRFLPPGGARCRFAPRQGLGPLRAAPVRNGGFPPRQGVAAGFLFIIKKERKNKIFFLRPGRPGAASRYSLTEEEILPRVMKKLPVFLTGGARSHFAPGRAWGHFAP